MLIEKDTIRSKAIFNDDRTHRFVLEKIWNKEKPILAVLSLNPALADNLIMDTTTFLIVTNVARLEKYGGVVILNLYSKLTNKLNFRWNSDEDLNEKANDDYIRKYAEECDAVVLAWGKGGEVNQRISERIGQVMELLSGLEEKLLQITDGFKHGIHPLCPSVRHEWFLEPLESSLDAEEAGESDGSDSGSAETQDHTRNQE